MQRLEARYWLTQGGGGVGPGRALTRVARRDCDSLEELTERTWPLVKPRAGLDSGGLLVPLLSSGAPSAHRSHSGGMGDPGGVGSTWRVYVAEPS